MSSPFMGEIRLCSFNFAPKGWALCNGQLLPINQNQALFSLLGTTYGGDGRTTFALPDLRGRAPNHMGNGFVLGERAGQEFHTLSQSELPAHTHAPNANPYEPSAPSPANDLWAAQTADGYTPGSAAQPVTMSPTSITATGGNQPHENRPPYGVVNYMIALQGIFPSQSGSNSGVDPFVAEIRIFAGNFAPMGWAFCDGQIMPLSQNTALFALLGTTYGGDGKSTFALPDLQGRIPIAPSDGGNGLSLRDLGQEGGSETVTLLQSEMPAHTHTVQAADSGTGLGNPSSAVFAAGARGRPPAYGPSSATVPMSPMAISVSGGSQPHNNMPPYLTLNFVIALQGIFPPRT